MFLLRRPTQDRIEAFVERQREATLTYAPVGLSRAAAPAGFVRGSHETRIGAGRSTFDAARRALMAWAPFRLGWVELHPPAAPIRVGVDVAVLARHLGFWSLHACRIVDVFGLEPEAIRCGFAYGTLAEHAETGEETFQLVLQPDGEVVFSVTAVARPSAPLARLGRPIAEHLQRRFRRESGEALARAARDQLEAGRRARAATAAPP